jgi:hypothetical protein
MVAIATTATAPHGVYSVTAPDGQTTRDQGNTAVPVALQLSTTGRRCRLNLPGMSSCGWRNTWVRQRPSLMCRSSE